MAAVFAQSFLVEATSPVVSILTRNSDLALGVRKDATLKPSVLLVVLAAVLAPGCAMVQIGVTNPIPGLSTVAVAPFLNLSAERATDGRRFALAYATELQKVPGFEVLPVGVTETAMIDAKVDLNDVDDVLKLAKVLRVDAVVVGAVTDYSPYYPAADRAADQLVFAAGLGVLSRNSNGAGGPSAALRLGQTTARKLSRESEAH